MRHSSRGRQEWIREQLKANRTVHIITDEQTYRDHFQFVFEEAVNERKITFGPNEATELSTFTKNPSHSIDKHTFERPTSVKEAVMDFFVLSKVEHVAWTLNSTVTHFAKYLRHKHHKPEVATFGKDPLYSSETTIGQYPAHTATRQFKLDVQTLTEKAEGLLINPEDFHLPPVLANVLNFLSDHHLEEIYNILYETLHNNGDTNYIAGSQIGNILYASSRAAQLNKKKWAATCKDLPDTRRFHWMKALIRYRLRNWSIRKAKEWCVAVDNSKEAYVYLTPVADNNCQMSGASGEEYGSDIEPPAKKAKGMWF